MIILKYIFKSGFHFLFVALFYPTCAFLVILPDKKKKFNKPKFSRLCPEVALSIPDSLTLVSPTPPINFSEEDFRWCVMAVAWWILQKGKNTRPLRPFPSTRDRFSCLNKPVSSGLAPWIYQRSVAVSLRPAMAAHKPVEWVQAVITRFDEQVRWVDFSGWV